MFYASSLSLMWISYFENNNINIYVFEGDLRLNEASNISFSLASSGESLIVFVITISDGNTDVKVQRDSLYGGDVYTDVVEIIPNSLQTM